MSEHTGALQAVGHPVRLRLLQRLDEGRTASISELAEAAAVHENTARAHVATLEEAGLIAGELRPMAGPGRPGVQYRLTTAGERLDEDFLGLAELLVAVIGRARLPPAHLREVGHEWGRYLAGRPGQDNAEERVPEVLGRLGFTASVQAGRVRLSGCPCPTVAGDQARLVCELATGVLDGVLAATGGRLRTGAAAHDPAARRCEITLIDVMADASYA